MPGAIEGSKSAVWPRAELAPPWHTALLVTLIVSVAATGTLLSSRGVAVQVPGTSRAIIYAQSMAVSWGLFFYVTRIGRPRNTFTLLLGKTWHSLGNAVVDLLLAISAWLMLKSCEWIFVRLFATSTNATVAAVLPRTPVELLLWTLLSISVGFCEEVVYRGYLQTQLGALIRSTSVGVLLQALLFGLAHGEQGLAAMMRIACYGLGLGILARWRRSLVPGILCHILINLSSGLLSF